MITLISGLVALAALVAWRGRGWWMRTVPLAFVARVLVAALAALVVDVLWRPSPDPLPFVTLLWTALSVAALILAVLRIRSAPRPIHFATRPCLSWPWRSSSSPELLR